MKYSELRAKMLDRSGRAPVSRLDQQAFRAIAAIRGFPKFNLWWEGLDPVDQDFALAQVKEAIQEG